MSDEDTVLTSVQKVEQWGANTAATYGNKITTEATNLAEGVTSAISSTGTWLSNAGETLSEGASSLVDSATSTAADIGGAASKAFSDAKGMVLDQTAENTKTLKKSTPWKIDSTDQYKDLFPIGRPCKFNKIVDPFHRFGNYLRSKMSVIDLIPVDYGVDLTRMADVVSGKADPEEEKRNMSIYSLGYDIQIKKYNRMCEYHGLKKYVGLRLFSTDDTTATDTIQVNYKDSTFQGMIDNLSGAGQSYRDAATLLVGPQATSQFSNTVTAKVDKAVEKANAILGGTDGIGKLLSGVANAATDMVMQGNKMTFPKIWQSSSYRGNLSVNIRLVSPYGHPKAIKEFIMKPLSYLILLAAPQTINGVTYGGSIPITIKAYGLNYTVVGSIASMTFRRGGSDTSFNLYRQPLTVDVSIEFQTLFEAFAVFDPNVLNEKLKTDRNIFNDPMLDDASSLNLYTQNNKNNLMVSLGTILASLRPVRIVDMNIDPQVYGMFEAPLRADIPSVPAFTPLAGNLGSAITGAVSSIGNFANMVTNAPKLIQQGLSNAVYNTAKGSVGSIVGSASSYLSSSSTAVNNVVNKVIGNIF